MSRHLSAPGEPTSSLVRYTVLNAMNPGLVECAADADVGSIARAMAEHEIHCVVVRGIERRDRHGERLDWGVVSDLDLMAALHPDGADATAGQLAATEVVIVAPSDTLERAARLMAEHQTAHVMVVDPVTGDPAGIVSTLDVARAAAS